MGMSAFSFPIILQIAMFCAIIHGVNYFFKLINLTNLIEVIHIFKLIRRDGIFRNTIGYICAYKLHARKQRLSMRVKNTNKLYKTIEHANKCPVHEN